MKGVLGSDLLLIISIYIIAHLGVALYAQSNPDAFLSGDRSRSRLEKINFTMNDFHNPAQLPELYSHPVYADDMERSSKITDSLHKMLVLGPPGDYAFHGLVYISLGELGVILFQLALGLLSIVCLFCTARHFDMSSKLAYFVVISYIMMPISLSTPHQLTTEGIFNPIVIIALYFLIIAGGYQHKFAFAVGLISIVVASALRIQFTVFPIILAFVYILGWHSRIRAMLVVAAGLAPFLVWSSIMWWNTGEFTTGKSNFGLGRNLFLQATRMASLGKFELDTTITGPYMDLVKYIGFIYQHLYTFLQFKISEATNLIFNPGTNYLLGDFFGLELFNPLDERGKALWNSLRTSAGLSTLLSIMMNQDIIWQAVFATMIMVWGVYLVLACVGASEMTQSKLIPWEEKVITLGYLSYTMLVVQISISRPAHRSSTDFVLVLLAGFGIRWVLRKLKKGTLDSLSLQKGGARREIS